LLWRIIQQTLGSPEISCSQFVAAALGGPMGASDAWEQKERLKNPREHLK